MLLNLAAGLILATAGLYDGQGQAIDYLQLKGSDITAVNYRVTGAGPGVSCVLVEGNRNTLRNLTVERCGATGVYLFSGAGHVLEDSVIRDPVRRAGQDSWGIYQHKATNITVRRTKVYGSGFSTGPLAGTYAIQDNEFAIPEDYRTNCAGGIQRDGACQCGEFGVVLKGGGGGVVERNTIRGYRKADPVCGGSGSPGAGIDLASSLNHTYNVVIRQNVITDSTVGIYVGTPVTNIRIEANRLCRNGTAVAAGSGTVEVIDNELFGNWLNLYGSRTGPVSGNRLVIYCD